ncbi:tubulin epsilon and delta complex protein 1 isoform X2 [Gorilla gorilla gorilla]|nr:tubulin epsilon and delta complex protein 1 isoform X2 [Gorilla gorilla gorilla]
MSGQRGDWTSALWQLLFRVLSPLPAGNALASLALEVQARLVKSALCSQGYPRLALAQLPEDGSQGSRELLLALSWLLARGPVPEQMLAQARVPLGDEMTVCQCEALASPGPPAPHMEAEGPVDVRHVQWLMGKLRFRWRQLVSSQQEQCALLSKIHLYTRGCHSDQSLSHLSVTEAEMLRDPEGGQQLLRTLERENQRLEAVLAWRRSELVFWRWMDTVLGTCAPEVPAAASQPTFLPWVPEHGGGELDLVVRELQALEEELRAAAERRRAAWEAKLHLSSMAGDTLRGTHPEGAGGHLVRSRSCCETAPAPPAGGWRLWTGARVECRAAGLSGGCGKGAGSFTAVLGARRWPGPAPWATPAGETRGWGSRGPRPAGSCGDQDAEEPGGLPGGGATSTTGTVSAGTGQAGGSPAWSHLDPATWTLKACRRALVWEACPGPAWLGLGGADSKARWPQGRCRRRAHVTCSLQGWGWADSGRSPGLWLAALGTGMAGPLRRS